MEEHSLKPLAEEVGGIIIAITSLIIPIICVILL